MCHTYITYHIYVCMRAPVRVRVCLCARARVCLFVDDHRILFDAVATCNVQIYSHGPY